MLYLVSFNTPINLLITILFWQGQLFILEYAQIQFLQVSYVPVVYESEGK